MDLRYYVSGCRLPIMPIADGLNVPFDGHKSHKNHLQVSSEQWRRLEGIQSLSTSRISAMLREWTESLENKRYTHTSKVNPNGQLTVPCPVLVQFHQDDLVRPGTIAELVSWIMYLPLKTAECAIHSFSPETLSYSFRLVHEAPNSDGDIFQAVCWSQLGNQDTEGITRLVLAIQPPWILSDKDIEMFSKSRSFPPHLKLGYAFPLQELKSEHRVWGKVFDLCVKQHTHWFILTSYNKWVFGAFSEGWTSGFVTDVYNYNDHDPTIVELLMFWVASAMRLPGTSFIPRVPEPVSHVFVPLSIPDQRGTVVHREDGPESASHWTGKSEDAPSSAGIEISEVGSNVSGMTGGPPAESKVYQYEIRQRTLEKWMKRQFKSGPLPPDATEIVPEGVKQMVHAPHNTHLGEWLV